MVVSMTMPNLPGGAKTVRVGRFLKLVARALVGGTDGFLVAAAAAASESAFCVAGVKTLAPGADCLSGSGGRGGCAGVVWEEAADGGGVGVSGGGFLRTDAPRAPATGFGASSEACAGLGAAAATERGYGWVCTGGGDTDFGATATGADFGSGATAGTAED